MISDQELHDLVAAARDSARHAYCPYSKFPVGAAVLTARRRIFAGCNVENASYGMTVCAERNAIFQAISAGERVILALVVYTPTKTATTPCGACRQVINEFGPKSLVLSICDSGETISMDLKDLLPSAFGPHNLTAS